SEALNSSLLSFYRFAETSVLLPRWPWETYRLYERRGRYEARGRVAQRDGCLTSQGRILDPPHACCHRQLTGRSCAAAALPRESLRFCSSKWIRHDSACGGRSRSRSLPRLPW